MFNSGESIAGGAAVSGLTITGGVAYSGGGMAFSGASANISNVVIDSCRADGSGTVLSLVTAQGGGAVSMYNSNASFDNCTFRRVLMWCFALHARRVSDAAAPVACSNNRAGYPGGGAGIFGEQNSNGLFTNCLVINNQIITSVMSKARVCSVMPRCACPHALTCLALPSVAPQGGGSKFITGSSPIFINTTFMGGNAYFGGAMWSDVRPFASL